MMNDFYIKRKKSDPRTVELLDSHTQNVVGRVVIEFFSNEYLICRHSEANGPDWIGQKWNCQFDGKDLGKIHGQVRVLEATEPQFHGKNLLKLELIHQPYVDGKKWTQFVFSRFSQLVASDLMKRSLVTVMPKTPVKTVVEKMAKRNVGAALVIDQNKALCGIFTERDFLNKAHHPDNYSHAIEKFMSVDLSTVNVDTELEVICNKLKGARFRHLPVEENGVPVGIISLRDLTNYWSKMNDIQKASITMDYERAMGVIVHDLRSPISAIQSMNELLVHDKNYMKEYLECDFPSMINESCRQMSQLIDDLLELSSTKQSQLQIVKKKEDLVAFVKTQISLFYGQAKSKNIDIQLQSSHEQFDFDFDRQRLSQVFINLLSNAVKYSDLGAIIEVHLQIQSDKVEFKVVDFGQGISESELPKIFDEHCKISSQPTAGEPSTGLGLSIAKRITERHGGELSVVSQPKKKTVFTVELPIAEEVKSAA